MAPKVTFFSNFSEKRGGAVKLKPDKQKKGFSRSLKPFDVYGRHERT